MARKLDQIIVLDIEATCWEGEIPRGQENEIIEVGLCLLEPKTGERSAKASYLVRPERSKVSEFCTRLTTLTLRNVSIVRGNSPGINHYQVGREDGRRG